MEISKQSKILILGNSGKIGSQIESQLRDLGYTNIQGSHDQDGARRVNLEDIKDMARFFSELNPEIIIMAAAPPHDLATHIRMIRAANIITTILMGCAFNQPNGCVILSEYSPVVRSMRKISYEMNISPDAKTRVGVLWVNVNTIDAELVINYMQQILNGKTD